MIQVHSKYNNEYYDWEGNDQNSPGSQRGLLFLTQCIAHNTSDLDKAINYDRINTFAYLSESYVVICLTGYV
jgi:hypothetical protein